MSHARKATASLLVAFLFSITVGRAYAQRYDHEDVVSRQFKVAQGGTLYVTADQGAIEVRGVDGDEVSVRVLKGADRISRDRAQELFDRYEVSFREIDGGIEIMGDYDRRPRWGRNPLHVRYEVTVPTSYGVDLKTSGGSITIERLEGASRMETSGGSLSIEDVGGEVWAQTSGGSISAERLGGEARLRTSGGSITARDVGGALDAHTSGGGIRVAGVAGPVDAQTSGGSITLDDIAGAVDAHTSGGSITAEITRQPKRDMSLQTSGGSVTVRLDPDIRADINARASGGSVHTDFPVTIRGDIRRDRLRGTINGGGPLLTLRSSGGGVRIAQR